MKASTKTTTNSLPYTYFHRIRIGELFFDLSISGFVKDINNKKIIISPFIYTDRLSTWSKLIQSLGSHAFKDIIFGSSSTTNSGQSHLHFFGSQKPKKILFGDGDDGEDEVQEH